MGKKANVIVIEKTQLGDIDEYILCDREPPNEGVSWVVNLRSGRMSLVSNSTDFERKAGEKWRVR